jgi:hypothetical protein
MDVARNKIIEVNEAALGGQTTAVLAESDGLQVACSDALDSNLCEAAYQSVDRPPAILWFGNSQNFAINRYKPGEELAVMTVHRWLNNRGVWLVSYTQPNANLHEVALLFEALTHRYDTRLVILPVFMDDLREQGIRASVGDFMDDPKAAERVRRSPTWNDVAPLLARNPKARSDPSIQSQVEDRLSALLGEYWSLWRDRSKLRGNLAFAIHILRNKVFGIHSYTKRPVNPKVYTDKLGVLERILESSRSKSTRMLLYIPPYRRDISGPYDTAQYAQFKEDVASLAAKYRVDFADLDDTVPGPLWATVVDSIFGFEEPDFMHFTAEGHRLLAKAMQTRLQDLGF